MTSSCRLVASPTTSHQLASFLRGVERRDDALVGVGVVFIGIAGKRHLEDDGGTGGVFALDEFLRNVEGGVRIDERRNVTPNNDMSSIPINVVYEVLTFGRETFGAIGCVGRLPFP